MLIILLIPTYCLLEYDVTNYIPAMLSSMRSYLGIVLADNMLELQQITYETASGQVLELISSTEGVHKIRALSQLKHRLGDGRMCWALFNTNNTNNNTSHMSPMGTSNNTNSNINSHHSNHTALPLVYIHVALSQELVTSMK